MEGNDVEIGAAMADQHSLRQACDEEQPDVVLPDIRVPTHPITRAEFAAIKANALA